MMRPQSSVSEDSMPKNAFVRLCLAAALAFSVFDAGAIAPPQTGVRTAQATTLKQCPKGYYWDRATVSCRRAN